jgi:hypothetical protein
MPEYRIVQRGFDGQQEDREIVRRFDGDGAAKAWAMGTVEVQRLEPIPVLSDVLARRAEDETAGKARERVSSGARPEDEGRTRRACQGFALRISGHALANRGVGKLAEGSMIQGGENTCLIG